jgi:broad specificity phosphatase PhoE
MTPHTIYFVRHGETVWNTERRLQGRKHSDLTERGREQAAANAVTLLEAVPDVKSLCFISSPQERARTSMEIIRARLDLPADRYIVDERLIELSFGAWEGMAAREIRSNEPDAWAAYEGSKWTEVPPGGESYAELIARVTSWLSDLRGDAVVVAHGAVGRAVRGLNLGVLPNDIPTFDTPAHDRVYRLSRGTEAVFG